MPMKSLLLHFCQETVLVPWTKLLFCNNLMVPLANGRKLVLEVILCYQPFTEKPIVLQQHIFSCLSKRYDRVSKILDLRAFHKDPDLYDLMYWPLSQQKMLYFVVKAVKTHYPTLRGIDISDNDISTVKPLASLWQTNIELLDLSLNKLKSISALSLLRPLKLMELKLDGNPLCKDYQGKEGLYISEVRSQIPSLKKLDGVLLGAEGSLCWRRNFLIVPEAHSLVNQFLEHYFTLFDGENRQRLRGVYHPDALFSLTVGFLPGQSTSSTARLTLYSMESRNMLKISDYSKNYNQLSQGSDKILSTLCKLPRTEHDPTSFAVDVMQHSAGNVMIVVSGVFREPSRMEKWSVLSFSRTFLLRDIGGREYQILNEMLHVCNATTKQAEINFKNPRRLMPMSMVAGMVAENMNEDDQEQITVIFAALTEMNSHWSRKCLNESKWDMKEALLVFTELLKMEKIPEEAFVKQ